MPVIELTLPSVLGYEKIARQAVEALAEEIQLAPDRIEDLKTVVAEACMNAIEHGNQLQSALPVTVQVLISPEKLEVWVGDRGREPLPPHAPEPTPTSQRGWGLFFIQRLVDELEVRRLPDGGNQLRMVIRLTKPAGGALGLTLPPPSAIQPAVTMSRAIQPAESKPRAIQPAENKPRAIQPAENKPKAILLASPQES